MHTATHLANMWDSTYQQWRSQKWNVPAPFHLDPRWPCMNRNLHLIGQQSGNSKLVGFHWLRVAPWSNGVVHFPQQPSNFYLLNLSTSRFHSRCLHSVGPDRTKTYCFLLVLLICHVLPEQIGCRSQQTNLKKGESHLASTVQTLIQKRDTLGMTIWPFQYNTLYL